MNKDTDICPLCNGLKTKILFSTKTACQEFHLIQCEKCELIRTVPSPADESRPVRNFTAYYGKGANKFVPFIQMMRNKIMKLRAGYYLSFIPDSIQTPKILDVGCAEGRFLKAFLKYGCQCWGIEHFFYPSQRFTNSDQINYLKGAPQNLDLPEGVFNLIFLWHVLEHMDNPRLIMSRLYELLAPDGVLVLAVPNFSSMEAKRFKRFWFHLDVHWHKYHFNRRSIGYLITKTHFTIIKSSTRCLEQGPYGLLQSILNVMDWPGNEFYEALKGNLTPGRAFYLLIQSFIGIFLLIPVFAVSLVTSSMERGSVLKLILKKDSN